jgi:hypothetical protein
MILPNSIPCWSWASGNVGIGAHIGLLRGLTLVPAAMRAAKLPGGKTLEDVLPADVFATWRVLRERYLAKDKDVERLRPAIALERPRSGRRSVVPAARARLRGRGAALTTSPLW